ncbi:hypothetical protein ACIHCQ_01960 [Streptomyces sp. NPDC052236]|uniref:hypothetical protein n=1 Tax=Streptomyces sp. NPDC052236 TaxID=3365686 RepID=UPI0037D96CD3
MMRDFEAWLPPSSGNVELMAAGRLWDAVRVPSGIGLSALARLGDDSGAVIEDTWGGLLYWLIRPGAAAAWELPKPCVEIRGKTSYVAVPPVWSTETYHRLRWIVPLTRTCYLTDPKPLHTALAAAIDALIGPQPGLLPCERCLAARMFGGRHGPCPCNHEPPQP